MEDRSVNMAAEPQVRTPRSTEVRPAPEQHAEVRPMPEQPADIDPRRVRFWLATLDMVLVVVSFNVVLLAQFWVRPVSEDEVRAQIGLFAASLPWWPLALRSSRLYTARANDRLGDELRNIAQAAVLGTIPVVAVAFAVQHETLSRFFVLGMVVSVVVLLALARLVLRRTFRTLRQRGRMIRRSLLVGPPDGDPGLLGAVLVSPGLGYRVAGTFAVEPQGSDTGGTDRATRCWISRLDSEIERLHVSSVFVASEVAPALTNRLVRHLTERGIHVAVETSLHDLDLRRLRLQALDGRALLYVEPVRRSGWRRIAKRAFDLTVATVGLVLAAPVLLCAAIAVKADTRGPVLFRQTRVGLDGRPFPLLKLRTMVVDAERLKPDLQELNEADGPLFKMRDDPRITRVGRALRRFSIDEIPQFVNVLRGDMSVVGPRPALPEEEREWSDELRARLTVPPGITGLWQVSGRSDAAFDEYQRLDLYYVDNWSLLHDLRIVLQSIGVVLRGTGAR